MEKINSFEKQEFSEKIVHLDKFHKVLGILWNYFDLKTVVPESQISAKHEFLKAWSSVQNFLDVVSPRFITLKVLFQKICMMKINWDDALPEAIITEW